VPVRRLTPFSPPVAKLEPSKQMAKNNSTGEMSNPDFYAVYSDVEAEFYAWKSEYVADLFSQLFNPSDSPTPAIQTFRLSSLISEQHQHQNTVKDCIYICDYDTDGKTIKSECKVPLTVVRADNFLPHLPYQFCTPSSRSITASMINNKSAPFIPYPDDPTFPQECYLSSFDSFQWIDDQRDPDGKFSLTCSAPLTYGVLRGGDPI
jgi:hypothetical protein